MAERLGPGQVVGDRYEIVRLLGRGGMAEIYLARELDYGREVALKTLSSRAGAVPELCTRLRREVELTGSVHHPNVVTVLDSGLMQDDCPYLVMEALLGETLGQCLTREGPLSPHRALRLMWQAASGLSAAHRAGIVHRDVKPDNLFLCGPLGEPRILKVLDFGLARVSVAARSNKAAVVKGTLEYMAPEQIVADPVDGRADIYGLGVVMFRALTGELPFDGTSVTELLKNHLKSPAPPPSWLVPDLNPAIDAVVLTALRKNPANRYAGMDDLLEDLRQLLGRKTHGLGAPLVHEPDVYQPRTDTGLRAFGMLDSHRERAAERSFAAA